jgi:hypothetical protein
MSAPRYGASKVVEIEVPQLQCPVTGSQNGRLEGRREGYDVCVHPFNRAADTSRERNRVCLGAGVKLAKARWHRARGVKFRAC